MDLGPGDTKSHTFPLGTLIIPLTWSGSSGNWFSQQTNPPLPLMLAKANAYNNGGAGNYLVAFGKGITKVTLIGSVSNSGIAVASGTVNGTAFVLGEAF